MRAVLVAALVAMSALPAQAMVTGPYAATFVSAYDGDTIRVDVEIWPQLTVHTSVRVRGVDTPEIRGACEEEKLKAIEARAFVATLLRHAALVQLTNIEPDKYGGRVDANVLVDGRDLSTLLVAARLGRVYNGGARLSWCE